MSVVGSCIRTRPRRGKPRLRSVQLGHTTRKEAGYVALPIDIILLSELRLYGTFGMQGQVVHQKVGLDGITGLLQATGSYDTTGVVLTLAIFTFCCSMQPTRHSKSTHKLETQFRTRSRLMT